MFVTIYHFLCHSSVNETDYNFTIITVMIAQEKIKHLLPYWTRTRIRDSATSAGNIPFTTVDALRCRTRKLLANRH